MFVLLAFRHVDVHGIVLQRNPGSFPTVARGYQWLAAGGAKTRRQASASHNSSKNRLPQ